MTPDLENDVRAAFGADTDSAIDVLNTYRPGEHDDGALRVRRAVLTLSKGDLGQLQHFAERARQDFRGVLFWVETPPDVDEPRTYAELRERMGLPPEAGHSGQ